MSYCELQQHQDKMQRSFCVFMATYINVPVTAHVQCYLLMDYSGRRSTTSPDCGSTDRLCHADKEEKEFLDLLLLSDQRQDPGETSL